MIRKATLKDIDTILELTKACARHMISESIYQWNEHYPNRNAFENDVSRNELYVIEEKSKIVGCVVISTLIDKEYTTVKWLSTDKNNLYIHRLAVHPKHQSKGFARKLMDFAENVAIRNNYVSIRLDTFSKNLRNQKFYELRGYIRLESIYFPKQSKHPFFCYERVL